MVLTLAFKVRGHELCLHGIILSCSSLPCPQEDPCIHPLAAPFPFRMGYTLKSINCVIIQQIYLVRTV